MRVSKRIFFVVELAMLAEILSFSYADSEAQERETQKESCANFASAPIPTYHLVREWRTDVEPMPVLFVSVKPRDVSRGSIIALACRIGAEHSSEQALDLYILDNLRAAKLFTPAYEGNSSKTERAHRATYEFSRTTDSQFLDWRPDPNDPSRWIHINLGLPPKRPDF